MVAIAIGMMAMAADHEILGREKAGAANIVQSPSFQTEDSRT